MSQFSMSSLNFDIFENIFSFCTPRDVVCIRHLSKTMRTFVDQFHRHRYYLAFNNYLQRFFQDPIAFRSLQARTGTLISGTTPVEFIDGFNNPFPKLEIFVHPGHVREVALWLISVERYEYVPEQAKDMDRFTDDIYWDKLVPWETGDEFFIMPFRVTRHGENDDVYHFSKFRMGEVVQIVLTASELVPIQSVMSLHSS
jgi:hypothetical protein